jgi:hypothetical protein
MTPSSCTRILVGDKAPEDPFEELEIEPCVGRETVSPQERSRWTTRCHRPPTDDGSHARAMATGT